MSTPTEYRLLKERHEALRGRLADLRKEWEAADALGIQTSFWVCADDLRALLEGDTR